MSEMFSGVSFPWQKVTPSDDAAVRRSLLSDGVLFGCELSFTGSTLTMQAGQAMACGRQFRHTNAENWSIVGATSGYARLLLTIDLSKESTESIFNQISARVEYASSLDAFAPLLQENLNNGGTIYQIPVCVVELSSGGISSIVSQWTDSVPLLRLTWGESVGYELPENPIDHQFFVLIKR